MILNHVIDFITDKDMQSSADVRLAMIAFLKELDKHLEKGYVPTKDVQIRLDELDEAVQKYEESLISTPFDNVDDENDGDEDDFDGDDNDLDDDNEDDVDDDVEFEDDDDSA